MMRQSKLFIIVVTLVLLTAMVFSCAGPIPTPEHIPTPTPASTPEPSPAPNSTPTNAPPIDTATPTVPATPKPTIFNGIVTDGRHPYGSLFGIPNATISYQGISTTTDENGRFSLILPSNESDPLLEITSMGYMPYREKPSRMVEGAFHLMILVK